MRPDVHAPRSGLNSQRWINEQLTTSRIAHTGHGAGLVFWGENVIVTITVSTAEETLSSDLHWTACSSPSTVSPEHSRRWQNSYNRTADPSETLRQF